MRLRVVLLTVTSKARSCISHSCNANVGWIARSRDGFSFFTTRVRVFENCSNFEFPAPLKIPPTLKLAAAAIAEFAVLEINGKIGDRRNYEKGRKGPGRREEEEGNRIRGDAVTKEEKIAKKIADFGRREKLIDYEASVRDFQ